MMHKISLGRYPILIKLVADLSKLAFVFLFGGSSILPGVYLKKK
jgi:hypothetical protein